jgi:serine/threonine-protein kinase
MLRFGERLSLDQFATLIAQVCDGLAAAHEVGVVHRDIKPGNVLVAGDVLKLTDFGVAQISRPPDEDRTEAKTVEADKEKEPDETATMNPNADPSLTNVGMLIGSPLYMAPELSQGADHASPRSDLFSFGMVAYEMLSGKRAYERSVVTALLKGNPTPEPPPPLASIAPDLPASVAAIVDRCLQLDPKARPDAETVVRSFQKM